MKNTSKEKNQNQKQLNIKSVYGITLIALVITVVVIVILAGVAIYLTLSNNGILTKASEAKFKTQIKAYQEKVNLYSSWKVMENMDNNVVNTINAGEMLKTAIEEEIIMDITRDDVSMELKEIIPELKNGEEELIVVYKGELYYVSNSTRAENSKYVKWCEEVNVPILECSPATGIVVRNGNYELVNGVYVCTPKLNVGFKETNTRYLKLDANGNLVPGKWISDRPDADWYSYKESKWANIYVENSGNDIYYVWIPRYCYKTLEGERTDVKFIDIDNSYKDEEGNLTTWDELKDEYQVPEAFTFDGEPIPGYWAMKYTVGEGNTQSTIYYDMIVNKGKITVKNITVNTTVTASNPITKYTFALNGKIIETIEDENKINNIGSQIVQFENMKAGRNIINVTGLNANGQIVGSYTTVYATAIVNTPDLTGFNKDTTFYVTYDDDGNEHSTVPISKEMPQYWYDYGETRWANIVTRNNGLETYYVWIPRYEYTTNSNERSTVKFLTGTAGADSGYLLPEAFTFDGQPITGFWTMKYTVGEEYAPMFDSEVTATSNSIKTKEITGTSASTGKVFNYYIDGELKATKTSTSETYEYTGLQSGKNYTVNIEIRDANDKYLGSITKQIKTLEPNKPELIGFNADRTYYVLYDDKGNEIIGDKIKNDGSNMPEGWYDYSSSKWANIVVTDGTVSEGKITGATATTYFTWIPRYEYKIDSVQQKQPTIGRTEVRFIEGKSTQVDTGYQIPEAFTFAGEQITGYWAMKYTVGQL